jgi:acyl-coenzyme A thioesterase PaaI-like protein
MSEPARGREDANHCFVCGPDNPHGLRITFRLEDDACRGEFTPGEHHMGFDAMTHGGIIYSALDDVMANWLFLQGARAVTAKCEIRYRKPLPVGMKADLKARMTQRKGRLCVLESTLKRADDGTVIASAEASFMIDDFGRLTRD